jgi:hypothetical protein
MCGCGRPTKIATGTDTAAFQIAGEHLRFVVGHRPGRWSDGDPRHPLRQGDWFAGFIDGEGCFFAQPWHKRRTGTLCVGFGLMVVLRADDQAILRECRDAFGGSLSHSSRGKGEQKPKWQWSVHDRFGRLALVDYFDAHPLRTKKARDYEVWRQIVTAHAEGRAPVELVPFSDQLRAVRAYREADAA